MASERSFQDRISRAAALKDAVALFTPAYAPVDPKFTLLALGTAVSQAENASDRVDQNQLPYEDAVTARKALVKALGPLITQSLAYIKSNTAWAKRYEAIKKAADKVRGVQPKAPKKGADPDPDKKARERGERSHAEIVAFFRSYLTRLAAIEGYAPPDEKIAIPTLEVNCQELEDLNTSLSTLGQILADGIRDRQEVMQTLKSVFDGIKISTKGQYGLRSPEYSAISGIKW